MDWDVLPQDPTGHSMATNPWAPKPLLTASTMINSCLAWSAHQADSWWLRYMEHKDIVKANIGGQAQGIFLHCMVSAQKNITVKAYTHSQIYSHIQRELKKTAKLKTHQTWREYKYLTALSTGSKKSSVWPPQCRVCSAVAPHRELTPNTFWTRQCWKK